MEQGRTGPFLLLLGIFGGGPFWFILVGLRFDYLVNEVYNGGGPGEAIWSMDPIFTAAAAIPGFFLVLFGILLSYRQYWVTKNQSDS